MNSEPPTSRTRSRSGPTGGVPNPPGDGDEVEQAVVAESGLTEHVGGEPLHHQPLRGPLGRERMEV